MATVDFYFDFISPYSYVAFKLFRNLKTPWSLHLRYHPIRLPHIIKESGNAPPARVPARRAFLTRDLRRTAEFYGLNFTPPPDFLSANMKMAAMLVIAAQQMFKDDDTVERIVESVWDRFFGQGDVKYFTDQVKDMLPLLREALDQTVNDDTLLSLLDATTSSQVEQIYIENNNQALHLGAFGVPTMIITRHGDNAQEYYFGSDRFHHIAHFLGKDPSSAYQIGILTSKL